MANVTSHKKLTSSQRREMWNEFADDVAYAAEVLVDRRMLPDFDDREFLHDQLLMISAMIRETGPGRPSKAGKAQRAARAVAARVFEKRKAWLSEHGKRRLPDSVRNRFIKEENEVELKRTGVRPAMVAVKDALRRGRSENASKKHSGLPLQEFKRLLEQQWLRNRGAK